MIVTISQHVGQAGENFSIKGRRDIPHLGAGEIMEVVSSIQLPASDPLDVTSPYTRRFSAKPMAIQTVKLLTGGPILGFVGKLYDFVCVPS